MLDVDLAECAVEQVLGEALSAQVLTGKELARCRESTDGGAFVLDNRTDVPADTSGTLVMKVRGPARSAVVVCREDRRASMRH